MSPVVIEYFRIRFNMRHLFLLISTLLVFTTISSFELASSESDIASNSVFDDLLPDIDIGDAYSYNPPDPINDYTFTSPDLFDDSINTDNPNPLNQPEDTNDMLFTSETYPSDSAILSLLDPELQDLTSGPPPSCLPDESRSAFCCDPTKEFVPSAVEDCIYCTKPFNSHISFSSPLLTSLHLIPYIIDLVPSTMPKTNLPPPFSPSRRSRPTQKMRPKQHLLL